MILLDKDSGAPQEQRGVNGAALVVVVDEQGNPVDVQAVIGPSEARSAVTDPEAAADVNQLLRGILTVLNAQTALLEAIAANTTTPSVE